VCLVLFAVNAGNFGFQLVSLLGGAHATVDGLMASGLLTLGLGLVLWCYVTPETRA
jgi:hypothetical protein